MIDIAWCARDLSNIPIGNHHFLYVRGLQPDRYPDKTIRLPDGTYGFTMGANNFGRDRLEGYVNDRHDLQALKEAAEGVAWDRPDLDLETHPIPLPPALSAEAFVQRLVSAFDAYQYNIEKHPPPIKYHAMGCDPRWPWCSGNCASWINSILAFVGLSEPVRRQLSDFSGLDIGQNLLLDLRYFDWEADWTIPPRPPIDPRRPQRHQHETRASSSAEVLSPELFEEV